MIDVYTVKFKSQDFNEYFQLVSDASVMEMITERAIPMDEARIDFEQLMENNKLNDNFGHFKILTVSSNEFVGLAKLVLNEENKVEAELGYMILPLYWGKGIASHVARKLIGHAKQQESLEKVVAIIDPKNIPSRKILINNGFVSKEFKDFDGLPGEILALELP
ncbi:Acetyltransferase (GNAT) family protein [compost metagenome]|uniref:GNAT family N-acetyltransferase n=1 Tax=Sphingobacterium faecium TaxID=34087 RepID=UPI000D44E71D|nr:GNAT family N-acetyltransferase [Sphingobacterium faecium]PTX11587.1 RimJ/RimL family protein N-acetyltransferase [Sphingobacterium faecium]GEM64544.1 N-acetyltransferase [Sphingobacterium faecium NBRC 15299]